MFKILGDTLIEKISTLIACAAYTFLVSFLGFLASSQFEDVRILQMGQIVQGTIVTVREGKSSASGMVAYRLPNGVDCLDWTELGSNSQIRQGEPLAVAVIGPCGHPVSTKARLSPWGYLCLCLGGILYPPFLGWRAFRKKRSVSTAV